MAFIWGLETPPRFHPTILPPHTQSPKFSFHIMSVSIYYSLKYYICMYSYHYCPISTHTLHYLSHNSTTRLSPSFDCADINLLPRCHSPLPYRQLNRRSSTEHSSRRMRELDVGLAWRSYHRFKWEGETHWSDYVPPYEYFKSIKSIQYSVFNRMGSPLSTTLISHIKVM